MNGVVRRAVWTLLPDLLTTPIREGGIKYIYYHLPSDWHIRFPLFTCLRIFFVDQIVFNYLIPTLVVCTSLGQSLQEGKKTQIYRCPVEESCYPWQDLRFRAYME
jgi:hypothetical protein